jgi:hypothetical protein
VLTSFLSLLFSSIRGCCTLPIALLLLAQISFAQKNGKHENSEHGNIARHYLRLPVRLPVGIVEDNLDYYALLMLRCAFCQYQETRYPRQTHL